MTQPGASAPPAARPAHPSHTSHTLGAVTALAVLAAAPALVMRASTAGRIHGAESARLEPAQAALVLGARVWPDGRPSRFLQERVEVGVRLYQRGLVSTLIMSGAGLNKEGLDEPAAMRSAARRLGVPDGDIVLDPHGWNTWASALGAVRLGVSSVIACSQEFHVPRAVWLCDRAGLAAQGAFAPVLPRRHTLLGYAREIPAAWKAAVDVRGAGARGAGAPAGDSPSSDSPSSDSPASDSPASGE